MTKTVDKPRKLAQVGDTMFERNLSILAAKQRELRIVTTNGDVHEGFAAGLDDEYLQLCLTEEDQRMILINRSYIVDVEETGRHLGDLELEDIEAASTIMEKTRMFSQVSYNHSGR